VEPDVKIVWRAFELRPDPAPTLDPKGDYLKQAWSSSVYPLAERLGVSMRLPPVQPRTRLAHQAAKWAGAQQRFNEYNDALFEAFFVRGEDIGKRDVLMKLAGELGLDSSKLSEALQSREFEQSVLKDERDAATMGLHGVPAFVVNRRAGLSGVQSVAALRALLDRVRAAPPPQ